MNNPHTELLLMVARFLIAYLRDASPEAKMLLLKQMELVEADLSAQRNAAGYIEEARGAVATSAGNIYTASPSRGSAS